MDNLSGDLRQVVLETIKSSLKLLILRPTRDGASIANDITSIANDILTSVKGGRAVIMGRKSLTPVRPSGLMEGDFGHRFLLLHRDLFHREMNRLFDEVFHDQA
jgi:hypothetical protein